MKENFYEKDGLIYRTTGETPEGATEISKKDFETKSEGISAEVEKASSEARTAASEAKIAKIENVVKGAKRTAMSNREADDLGDLLKEALGIN